MTLVVARKIEGAIIIVGDTKLTSTMLQERVPVTAGAIKTKIVSSHLAVAFAGNEYIAEIAITQIQAADQFGDVSRFLLDAHLSARRENTADFVVASLAPNAKLAVIKDGGYSLVETAWIGDADAFRLFRAYETGNRAPSTPIANTASMTVEALPGLTGEPPRPLVESYSRSLRCMKWLADDEEAETVGGFAIPVIGLNSAFNYMSYADVRTHPLTFLPGWNTVHFGTAAEGGYAYDVVVNGDHRGLSSYFPQGRFGIVYRSADGGLLRPELILNVSAIEFEEEGTRLVGASVGTFYADNRLFCQRAMDKFANGDIDGAIQDADRAIARATQNPEGWICRGTIYFRLGNAELAFSDLKTAARLSPNEADHWNKIGIALLMIRMVEESIDAFTNALARDRTFWQALANRANAHWQQGQFQDALEDIFGALCHKSDDVHLWRNGAAVCLRLGQPVRAQECLARALELSPDDEAIRREFSTLQFELASQSDRGDRPTHE